MPRALVLLVTLSAAMIATPASAGEGDPGTGAPRRSAAPLIVVGRVGSLKFSKGLGKDGSEFGTALLEVEVEAVEKGGGPVPGKTFYIYVLVPITEPSGGAAGDRGLRNVPGPGSKARFFLHDGAGNNYATLWPDGIEPLEVSAWLTCGDSPTPTVKAQSRARAGWWSWWSFFIGIGLALITRWTVRWNVTTRTKGGDIVSRDGGVSTR
jgi:hypothetical protein